MERKELLNELFTLIEDIKNKQLEIEELEEVKKQKWDIINPLLLQIQKDVYSDTQYKNSEQRETEINFRKYNDAIIQNTMKEIEKLNNEINFLRIELEFLENKFKSYRLVYANSLL